MREGKQGMMSDLLPPELMWLGLSLVAERLVGPENQEGDGLDMPLPWDVCVVHQDAALLGNSAEC